MYLIIAIQLENSLVNPAAISRNSTYEWTCSETVDIKIDIDNTKWDDKWDSTWIHICSLFTVNWMHSSTTSHLHRTTQTDLPPDPISSHLYPFIECVWASVWQHASALTGNLLARSTCNIYNNNNNILIPIFTFYGYEEEFRFKIQDSKDFIVYHKVTENLLW